MSTSRVTKWESKDSFYSGEAMIKTRMFDFGDTLARKNIYSFYISFTPETNVQDEINASIYFRLVSGGDWNPFGACTSAMSGGTPYVYARPTSATHPPENTFHENGVHMLKDIQVIQFKILFFF